MKKNVYNFAYYMENEHNKKIKIMKKKMTIVIIFITLLLIVLSKILFGNNANSMETSANAQYAQEEKEMERLEQERLKKEEEERLAREAKLPKVTEAGIENLEHIYSSEEKRVFLTFDDGPSPVTNQILDTLRENDIKATFFVLGSNVKNYPETTKKIFDEGHFIANHSYTHVYSSVYASKEAVLDEFNRCNDAVREAIGEPEYNSHLFRFPGGLAGGKYATLKKEAKQLLNENGIYNIDWNSLSGDAEKQNPTPEYLMKRIKETSEGKNSLVVLMHDAAAKKTTADTLSQIIAYYKEQGYEFKTFYDIFTQ